MVDHILEIPEPNVKNVIPHNYVYKQRRYLWLYDYYVNINLFFSFKQGVKLKIKIINSTFFRSNSSYFRSDYTFFRPNSTIFKYRIQYLQYNICTKFGNFICNM